MKTKFISIIKELFDTSTYKWIIRNDLQYMKKLVAYILSWSLYYIGDLTSNIMLKISWNWLFIFYNWSMINSNKIQDWGKLKTPWSTPPENFRL